MENENAMVRAVGDGQARVNVTWARQNGDLPDPVPVDATDGDVRQMVTEALRGGGIPGIPADPQADLSDFVVDRFEPTGVRPFNYISVRPKTPFGDGLDEEVRRLVRLAHDRGEEKEDLVLQVVMAWETLYED